MKRVQPSGTVIEFATRQAPRVEPLPLDTHVPRPTPRYGKGARYRETLLSMHGDASFVVDDATLVYAEAKKLGIVIQTERKGKKVRVWRVK